jgi:hypothetical protein
MEQDTPLVPEIGKETPDAISVSEFMAKPVYDKEVTVYGRMEHYGELMCPCFMLRDSGDEVNAWYGMMSIDGKELSDVSMQGYSNGDWVIVKGVYLPGEAKQFYMKSIEKMELVHGDITQREQIVRDFIENSPEYEGGAMLELEESLAAACVDCFGYKYKFVTIVVEGYDQTVTPHEAFIEVTKGKVTRATMDQNMDDMTAWDMITHKNIELSPYSA